MYLIVEENPNSAPEERVFAESGAERAVRQVLLDHPGGGTGWCDVTGVEDDGRYVEARARLVDDSAAGTAWLVTGGAWGLRLRPSGGGAWSLTDTSQWGVPFLVLDAQALKLENP